MDRHSHTAHANGCASTSACDLVIKKQYGSAKNALLMNGTIAALYVEASGVYANLAGVDAWDVERDARTYAGPHPVVAHPPCQRWGRYHGGAPTQWPRLIKGDDGGCFAAALAAVRRWGGILEHPEGSAAWDAHGLLTPPHTGGWIRADAVHGWDGWTCCVEQGWYGHAARKKTWLYAVGVELPMLIWGKSPATVRLDEGYHSAEERRRAVKTGICQRLSKRQRAATPVPFRDLLLSMARTVRGNHETGPRAGGAGADIPGLVKFLPNFRAGALATPELARGFLGARA